MDEDNKTEITDENNKNKEEEANNKVNQMEVTNKKPIALYIEIAFILVGIILLAVGSLQLKSIAHVKWNKVTEIAFPLGLIFIVSPGLLYFKRLREKTFSIIILIIFAIGAIMTYILLGPYKMFTVHFGLLGDVIAEYIIGLFFIVFFVSHLTKKHVIEKYKTNTN